MTDGERVMGLETWACRAWPPREVNLYTLGGVDPADVALCLDVGTNNQELLNDPCTWATRWNASRERRTTSSWTPSTPSSVARRACIVQFEDGNTNEAAAERYATQAAIFNDDIHGVAATTLAGIIAATPKTGHSVDEHTYPPAGAGETGTASADDCRVRGQKTA